MSPTQSDMDEIRPGWDSPFPFPKRLSPVQAADIAPDLGETSQLFCQNVGIFDGVR